MLSLTILIRDDYAWCQKRFWTDIFTKHRPRTRTKLIVPEERFLKAAKDIYTANWDKPACLLISLRLQYNPISNG